MPDADTKLARAEVAALLRCSVSTVDSRIADGTLPASKLGRRVLIRRDDVASMLAARVKRSASRP
ncbi:DNA-binding protein [Nocardioides oleivorans]|uniref:DNA-binding protein n=1 Tax=Nocardioides oleivorans TaxID=273676 RepID=A0A4Q2S0S9_9ACTN|nr:DNA-binding protein [Nocardioides oleivorans]